MYTANVAGQMFEYQDINEQDAYNIAIQVLQCCKQRLSITRKDLRNKVVSVCCITY